MEFTGDAEGHLVESILGLRVSDCVTGGKSLATIPLDAFAIKKGFLIYLRIGRNLRSHLFLPLTQIMNSLKHL